MAPFLSASNLSNLHQMPFKRALLALYLLLELIPAGACQISLAYTEHPSPPFLEGEGTNIPAKPGIAVEIVTFAVEQAGCTVHLARSANLRVLRSVGSGDVDGAILFSFDAERGREMMFPHKGEEIDASRRLATLNYFLYRRTGGKIDWDGVKLSNPEGLPIGINTGFSIADLFSKLGARLDEVPTTEQNLGKLRLGRIAGYAMQDRIADAVILRMQFEHEIEKLPVPLQTKNYYLTFSQKFYAAHADVAEKIWSIIGEKREQMTKALQPHYHD